MEGEKIRQINSNLAETKIGTPTKKRIDLHTKKNQDSGRRSHLYHHKHKRDETRKLDIN